MTFMEEWVICAKRSCKYSAKLNTWREVQHPTMLNATTFVCPRCGNNSYQKEKPLFIPLRTQWFQEYKAGRKDTEYRPVGPRWNVDTCRPGRKVILSHGYSGQRLTGVIVGITYHNSPADHIRDWRLTYGLGPAQAICIKIQLNP
jgi:hypothetical protein